MHVTVMLKMHYLLWESLWILNVHTYLQKHMPWACMHTQHTVATTFMLEVCPTFFMFCVITISCDDVMW